MKIAIVDDDPIFTDKLKKTINSHINNTIIDTYQYFDENIYNNQYDCVFLDVMLKEGESFKFGDKLQSLYPHIIIVYLSNFDHFIYQSIMQNTFYFIRKSYFNEDFNNFIAKYNNIISKQKETITFTIKNTSITIPQQDITYIESMRNTITIHTLTQSYTIYITLKEIYQKLNQKQFYKLNAHIIINLDSIIKIEKNSILLTQNISIPFTRGSKKPFMQKYILHRSTHIWNGY